MGKWETNCGAGHAQLISVERPGGQNGNKDCKSAAANGFACSFVLYFHYFNFRKVGPTHYLPDIFIRQSLFVGDLLLVAGS